MSLFQQLASKPWLSKGLKTPVGIPEQADVANLSAKTALKFFLAVITVIFFLFTVTLVQRSQVFDFQALSGKPWLPFNDLGLLWENTTALFCASVCLAMSNYFGKNNSKLLFLCLAAALIFSSVFVVGQLYVWQYLNYSGFTIHTNPANSYFFLLTGVHGLHIIGGMFALIRVIYLYHKSTTQQQLFFAIKLCTLYWHYLFLIWLFLFFLLTRSASSLRAIALICGFSTA